MLVNVKVMGRTHGGAWDGGGEAQVASLKMRQLDYVCGGDDFMPKP